MVLEVTSYSTDWRFLKDYVWNGIRRKTTFFAIKCNCITWDEESHKFNPSTGSGTVEIKLGMQGNYKWNDKG